MTRRTFAAAAAGMATSRTVAAATSDLRVGALFPLSGTMASLGQETFAGAEIAKELINESGGVAGRRVEWVLGDTLDTAAAISEVKRIIDVEKVSTILGAYGSAQTLAIADLTERLGVVLWVDTAWSSALFAKPRHWTFRTSTFATPVTKLAVSYAREHLLPAIVSQAGSGRTAIVNENGPYGESLAHELAVAAEAQGVKIDLRLPYDRGGTDLRNVAESLAHDHVDFVFASSFPDDAARLLKSMETVGYRPKAIMTTSTGWAIHTLPGELGAACDGIYVSNAPSVAGDDLLNGRGRSLRDAFVERFKKSKGREPSAFAAMGFVAAISLLADVLATATDPTSAASVRAAAVAADVPTGSYPNGWGLRIDATGQNERTTAVIDQWRDGVLKTIYVPT